MHVCRLQPKTFKLISYLNLFCIHREKESLSVIVSAMCTVSNIKYEINVTHLCIISCIQADDMYVYLLYSILTIIRLRYCFVDDNLCDVYIQVNISTVSYLICIYVSFLPRHLLLACHQLLLVPVNQSCFGQLQLLLQQ